MTREEFFYKPKVDPNKKPNKLVAIAHQRLNQHQSVSLCFKDGKKFWRHRYTIAPSNLHHFQERDDYPIEQFKSIGEFADFIVQQPLKDKQLTSSGIHRAKPEEDENRENSE